MEAAKKRHSIDNSRTVKCKCLPQQTEIPAQVAFRNSTRIIAEEIMQQCERDRNDGSESHRLRKTLIQCPPPPVGQNKKRYDKNCRLTVECGKQRQDT